MEFLSGDWLAFLFLNPWYAIPILMVQFAALAEFRIRYGNLFRPLEVWFSIQNWVVNISFTVVFLDPPKEPFELVTMRMKRYKKRYANVGAHTQLDKWRTWFAFKLCAWLNRYDKGHC